MAGKEVIVLSSNSVAKGVLQLLEIWIYGRLVSSSRPGPELSPSLPPHL